jgi:hypothetical protein
MRVQEFPLAWRWTDSRYAVFSEAVLSQLQPLGAQDAQLAFERVRSFQQDSCITHSADVSDEAGCAWLRARHGGLSEIVTVSWSPDCALRTSWQIFTEHWSDFCYPSSDDVAVWPDSERWVLFYHHEEKFEFVQRPTAQ